MQDPKPPRSEAAEADGARDRPPVRDLELEELRVKLAAREAEIKALQRDRDLAQRDLAQLATRLAAVEASALRQAERQAELQSLLLDAHEQLVLRDELLARTVPNEQPLTALLIRARSWRHRLTSRLGLVRP
jgi:hypothetical protein